MKLKTCVLLALLAAKGLAADPVPATLSGSILATDGSGLPGARVTVLPEGPDSRPAAVIASGERGLFLVRGLPAGTFQLRIELPGFETRTVANVRLAPGDRRDLAVTLRVAGIRESVTVVSPSPRDAVEAAEIRESSARDVGDALVQLPGVWKLRKGGIASDVVVRGYQSRDLNVLVDGERIYGACPNHMDPPSFHVDFAQVDRVEVAKGPFDVRNQGSLGGVVSIVTRRPEPGFHATANGAAGSWGYANPSVSASWAGEAFSALAGYSYRRSTAFSDGDGRRFTELTNYRADAVDGEAFRAGTAWTRVGFVPAKDHAVTFSYTRQDTSHTYYPYLQMDAVYDDSDRFGLTWEATPSAVVTAAKLSTYYAQVDHWMTDEYRTTGAPAARGWSMGTDAFSRTLGGRLEATAWGVTAGVEAYRRYWDTTTYLAGMQYKPQASLPGATTDVFGLFAERSFRLGGTVILDAGLRWDHASASVDGEKASTDLTWAYHGTRATEQDDALAGGSLRARWQAAEGLEVSLGAGTAARIPEPQERWFSLKRMGTDWVGNPDLAPSRNTALDLSASFRAGRVYVSASAFVNEVADTIILADVARVNVVPGVMNPKARTYENVDARLAGGEATAAVTLTGTLFFSGAVSYVRGTQDPRPELGILSEYVAEMPPVTGRASLRWDNGRFWGEAEGVFAAAQTHVDTDLLESTTPGWGIATLRAGIAFGDVGLNVGVENLFGRLYSEHLSYQRDPFRSGVKIPEPGRNVFVNLSYRY
ncbi:MAG: TonB-dependent receptor [Holophagales bacterium]|nr:TonB-dependent receptor [Holophagales bacterium]